MEYVFTCPAQGCKFSIKVETKNPDWAVEKITELSLFHGDHVHPKMTSMTAEQIRTVVLSGIKE